MKKYAKIGCAVAVFSAASLISNAQETPAPAVLPAAVIQPAISVQRAVPAAVLVPAVPSSSAGKSVMNDVRVTPSEDGKSVIVEIPSMGKGEGCSCRMQAVTRADAVPAVKTIPAQVLTPAVKAIPAQVLTPAANVPVVRTFRSGNGIVTVIRPSSGEQAQTTVNQVQETSAVHQTNLPNVRTERLEDGSVRITIAPAAAEAAGQAVH